MNLNDVRKLTAQLAPRILIHGQEGVGKTTIASKFPSPIFLQTEDGCPGGLEIDSFGLIESFTDLRSAIAALASEPHHFQTVVVDSVDAVEALIWADVCKSQGWPSIESPGYGKGYVVTDNWWLDVLKGLDYLRRRRGMTVALLAHSAIEIISDPRVAAYTSYQLRLHKRARGLVQDTMDAIGFLAPDLHVQSEEVGFGKKRKPRRRRLTTLVALRGAAGLRRQKPIWLTGKDAGAARLQLRGVRPVPAAAAVGGYRRQTKSKTH
jgi:AAA domain